MVLVLYATTHLIPRSAIGYSPHLKPRERGSQKPFGDRDLGLLEFEGHKDWGLAFTRSLKVKGWWGKPALWQNEERGLS